MAAACHRQIEAQATSAIVCLCQIFNIIGETRIILILACFEKIELSRKNVHKNKILHISIIWSINKMNIFDVMVICGVYVSALTTM